MTNAYVERLNQFKKDISYKAETSKLLKKEFKQLQRVYSESGPGGPRRNWGEMMRCLGQIESNKTAIHLLLNHREILKRESRDYWITKKRYNENIITTE